MEAYKANEYHLLLKNCNHFTNDLSLRLLNKPIPSYVNRSAAFTHCMSCTVPPSFWDTYILSHETKPILPKQS